MVMNLKQLATEITEYSFNIKDLVERVQRTQREEKTFYPRFCQKPGFLVVQNSFSFHWMDFVQNPPVYPSVNSVSSVANMPSVAKKEMI
jgi:hypothetical protein